jgi:MtN3 and saliva related transmembrane protein
MLYRATVCKSCCAILLCLFFGAAKTLFMKDFSLYVGIASGICTAVSQVPQLIKIIKEKEADDISYWMLIILLLGVAGWTWYGILKNDYPIIITNGFSCFMNLMIIAFSIRYKKGKA